jgi:AbrB family looped-hinge helix DNA binding protein
MPTATLTSKGQITLPKEVREHLHLAEGDRVEFVIQPQGDVQIQPLKGSVQKLFGMLHRPGMRATSLEQMDQALLEALAEDDARIRRGED